jgi:hypothetical protein
MQWLSAWRKLRLLIHREADPPQLAPEMQRCLKGRSLWGIFHPAVSQLREQHVGKRVFESLQL